MEYQSNTTKEVNMHFVVGYHYLVTKSDGSIIEFQFIGGNPPMVLLNNGQKITLSDALNNYKEVRQIEKK